MNVVMKWWRAELPSGESPWDYVGLLLAASGLSPLPLAIVAMSIVGGAPIGLIALAAAVAVMYVLWLSRIFRMVARAWRDAPSPSGLPRTPPVHVGHREVLASLRQFEKNQSTTNC